MVGMMRSSTQMGGGESTAGGLNSGKANLPGSAMTSLCEIKFNRKDVKAMNTLMCRRLVSALYQCKVDANKEADTQGKARQGFPDFVPDQFVVLYGIKSLAIKNINEFLYGVRAERTRRSSEAEDAPREIEPLLTPFWRATHHGVPFEERMPASDFDFYLDLLGLVAKTVGEEHTLKMPGIGAFWHLLGSMAEIQLPVFVCINVLSKAFEKGEMLQHKDLFERLKRMTTQAAAAHQKLMKDPKKAPKPPPPYKTHPLGDATLDSRGHLGLETFLSLAMEGAGKQREKDAKILESIYKSWEADAGEASFDVFSECFLAANPNISENDLISLYQTATGGENPDEPDFSLIEGQLRKRNITLKAKGGLQNGEAMKIDDIKTMTTVSTLFVAPKKKGGGLGNVVTTVTTGDEPAAESSATASISKSRWLKAGKTAAASSIVAIMKMMQEADEAEGAPAPE